MSKEYTIYCDESESKGRHFSNFYGGALVISHDLDAVKSAISRKKHDLNLFGEIKWTKITVNYYKKYIEIMDFFFDLIKDDKIKIRIMFTQNAMRPSRLTRDHIDNQYGILYYYFIRHAFGLMYSPLNQVDTRVRVYPDRLPMTAAQVRTFKEFVVRLGNRTEFRNRHLKFHMEDVTEVNSHDHDILQCLDVVLGAMNFRLNKKHKDKPTGTTRRPAKTRAKEKVYQHINKRIRDIYPNFNIGITTGHGGDLANRWNHAYRHWNFLTRGGWR
jgi:hypothetical protein